MRDRNGEIGERVKQRYKGTERQRYMDRHTDGGKDTGRDKTHMGEIDISENERQRD